MNIDKQIELLGWKVAYDGYVTDSGIYEWCWKNNEEKLESEIRIIYNHGSNLIIATRFDSIFRAHYPIILTLEEMNAFTRKMHEIKELMELPL